MRPDVLKLNSFTPTEYLAYASAIKEEAGVCSSVSGVAGM